MSTNWNKIIEDYLNEELSSEEEIKFKQTIEVNPEVAEELKLHQITREVIKRNTLREQVKKTSFQFHLRKRMFNLGILIVVGATIAAIAFLLVHFKNQNKIQQIPSSKMTILDSLNENLVFQNIPGQYFYFNGKSDIFFSKTGVLLNVTQNSFLLNGKPYHGKATIQWQEVRTPGDIVSAGLSTLSNNKLLETQGMFSIKAYTLDGQELSLSKEGVYVQVPVDSLKKDMKLFTGMRETNGNINWTNPKELNRIPIQMNMSQMDLFPPNFEPTLNKMKWDTSKKKRDSLYLSFEPKNLISDSIGIYRININDDISINDSLYKIATMRRKSSNKAAVIPPSMILSIWNSKYNHTNLATQEFQERIPYIHRTCSKEVLDLYVQNLNLPIWKIDEKVAKMGFPQFQKFAHERIGKVEVNSSQQKNLNAFYSKTIKYFHQLGRRRVDSILQVRRDENRNFQKKNTEQYLRNRNLKSNNFQKEVILNFNSVCKQLGIKKRIGFTIGSRTSSNLGNVVNLDRFVANTTLTRETATFTVKNGSVQLDNKKVKMNHKSATITYKKMKVVINDAKQYQQLYMYCFPKELNSYVRQNPKNGKFSYSLNMSFHYSAAIVGINKDGFFYYPIKHLKPKDFGVIILKPISKKEFKLRINALNNGVKDSSKPIIDEIQWIFGAQVHYTVLAKEHKMQVFRNKIQSTIYLCGVPKVETEIISSTQNISPSDQEIKQKSHYRLKVGYYKPR